MTISGTFERFQYFHFETNFLKNRNLFQKTVVPFSSWKYLDWKCNISIQICLSSKKPMLRQIEWGVQNGPITKNGVLPVTSLFFGKFCFSLGTWYKELIWCTNHLNVHIHSFRNRWSFIWGCFFPVSMLNLSYVNNEECYKAIWTVHLVHLLWTWSKKYLLGGGHLVLVLLAALVHSTNLKVFLR